MGAMNEMAAKTTARLLCYGKQKSRKTMWAMSAAEAGFNVLLLDGDDGYHIGMAKKASGSKDMLFSEAARKRINVVRLVDSPSNHKFTDFLVEFFRAKGEFFFNENTSKFYRTRPTGIGEVLAIDPTKLTTNDVVIIDSWTALVQSMKLKYSTQNGIDLADAAKTDWPGYGWMGNLSTEIVRMMHSMPCHIVIIGHEQVYEKYQGTGNDRRLVEQRTQVQTTSGPAGRSFGKDFSDILTFNIKSTGTEISTKSSATTEGGSRLIPPDTFIFNNPQTGASDTPKTNFTFSQFIRMAGLTMATKDAIPPYRWLQT